MKSKLSFCLLIAVLLITGSVHAQQPKKVHQIGYLSSSDTVTDAPRSEGIRLALPELGYVEGRNIAIEYRYGEGKQDMYPELATELVYLKVDIIVVSGGAPAIRAAKNATKKRSCRFRWAHVLRGGPRG